MIRRPVLRWCACVGQIDIFVTPTFSFTCKGRGLTVLAASLSRGVLALGAGRGLDVVLAVPDDTTAVTTFLRFVTGSSMTSARGLKFSHIAVYNQRSASSAGITGNLFRSRFCSADCGTIHIARLCTGRQRDQEKVQVDKVRWPQARFWALSWNRNLPEACTLGTWPIKPRVQDAPCYFS